MPARHSRHIALTGPLAEYVTRQVEEGRYASVSEVMRAALRLLIDSDQLGARSDKKDRAKVRKDRA